MPLIPTESFGYVLLAVVAGGVCVLLLRDLGRKNRRRVL